MYNIIRKNEYPDNLLLAVLGKDYKNKACKEVEKSLIYIYENILTKRQQIIIDSRYKDLKSLDVTGNIIGLSKEGTRIAIKKIIELYKRPYILSLLTEGINATLQKHKDKIEYSINQQKEIQKSIHSNPKNLPLYYLEISVKTFNSVVNGLSYIGSPANISIKHILNLGPEGLAKINNIGQKSFTELVNEIEKIGINVDSFKKHKLYKHKSR